MYVYYTYIEIHIYRDIEIYVCMHACMYVCICMSMYVYVCICACIVVWMLEKYILSCTPSKESNGKEKKWWVALSVQKMKVICIDEGI